MKTYKTKEYPNGVQCRHVFIRTTGRDEHGEQGIYKVVDTINAGGERIAIGYLGESAILRIERIFQGSEERISYLHEVRSHIDRRDYPN